MFFELEDIQRRHSPYWDLTNVTGWTNALDASPSWCFQRGVLLGLPAAWAQQYISSVIVNFKAMLTKYETPTNLKQWWVMLRETHKLPGFKRNAMNRFQIGASVAVLDIAPKLTAWRIFNGGWMSNYGGFDYNLFRKLPTAFFAAVVSSPLAVGLSAAREAFAAERTFPQHLRKGYTSFWNCLRRIPFQEGPYYLYKNSWPLFAHHIYSTFTLFYAYDWLKDKLSVMYRASTYPRQIPLMFSALVSTMIAAVLTYPIETARQMIQVWPKKNGVCPYDGNYRKAFTYLWYSQVWNHSFPGFLKLYFWNQAPKWFFTLCLADRLGFFTFWRVDIMSGPGDNTNDDSFI